MSISILNRGASGGLRPELLVTAPSGSIIDLLQNGIIVDTYTLSASETEHTFAVKVGTYTVRCTLGADAAEDTVMIDTVGQYEVMLYYHDYGDGSYNTLVGGYVNKLYLNGAKANGISPYQGTATSGNFYDCSQASGIANSLYAVMDSAKTGGTAFSALTAGMSDYTFDVDATREPVSIRHKIHSGAHSPNTVAGLMYKVGGAYYTLEQMVVNRIIKPIVVIGSCTNNGPYYYPNILNIYTGGSSSSGTYPSVVLYFMLNMGYKITGAKWSMVNGGIYGADLGWEVNYAPIDSFRMTLS